jgi:cell fate regulator YaaT (PSP1 superfamily)
MCCLKYEDVAYKELRTGLPKMNAQVSYQGKNYRMTSLNVLTRQVKIENREEALFMPIEELFPDAPKPEETHVTIHVDGKEYEARLPEEKDKK